MAQRDRIVAFGLLTQREVDVLGTSFERAYPIDQARFFGKLLCAIDEADRQSAEPIKPPISAASCAAPGGDS